MSKTPLLYKFPEREKKGSEYEGLVAARLAHEEFTVVMSPRRIRLESESPDSFKGQIDLTIYHDKQELSKLEVKGRPKESFTSVATFRYPTILICNEKAHHKDLPYAIVSGVTKKIIVALPSTNRFVDYQYDRERDYSYKAILAPKKDFMEFEEFVKWLNEKRV